MAHDPADHDELLQHVDVNRRRFIGKVLVGSVFAAPVVSSFSMSGVNSVFAQDTNVSGQVAGSDTEQSTSTTTTTTAGNTTTTTSNTTTTTGNTTVTTSNTTSGNLF